MKRADVKIQMQKRDFTRIASVKRGDKITCDSGTLWVTQKGNHNDYILRPGMVMQVAQKGEVLIEAIDDAKLHIS